MAQPRAVNIGIIGTGFIAETRARCYAGVSGYQVRLVAAATVKTGRLAGRRVELNLSS